MDWENSKNSKNRGGNIPTKVTVQRHLAPKSQEKSRSGHRQVDPLAFSFSNRDEEENVEEIPSDILPSDLFSTLQELEKLKYRGELQKLKSTVTRLRELTSQFDQLKEQERVASHSTFDEENRDFDLRNSQNSSSSRQDFRAPSPFERNQRNEPLNQRRPQNSTYHDQRSTPIQTQKLNNNRNHSSASKLHQTIQKVPSTNDQDRFGRRVSTGDRSFARYVEGNESNAQFKTSLPVHLKRKSQLSGYDLESEAITESDYSEQEPKLRNLEPFSIRSARTPPSSRQHERNQSGSKGLPHSKSHSKKGNKQHTPKSKQSQVRGRSHNRRNERYDEEEDYSDDGSDEEEDTEDTDDDKAELKAIMKYLQQQNQEISTMKNQLSALTVENERFKTNQYENQRGSHLQNNSLDSRRISLSSPKNSRKQQQNHQQRSMNHQQQYAREQDEEEEAEDSEDSVDSPLEEFSDSAYRSWKDAKRQNNSNVPVQAEYDPHAYAELVAVADRQLQVEKELEGTAQLLQHYRNQLQQAQREAASLGINDETFNGDYEGNTEDDEEDVESGDETIDEVVSNFVGGDFINRLQTLEGYKHLSPPQQAEFVKQYIEYLQNLEESIETLPPQNETRSVSTQNSTGEQLLDRLSNRGASASTMTQEELEQMMTYLGNEISNGMSPFLGTPNDGAFLLAVLRNMAVVQHLKLEKEFLNWTADWISSKVGEPEKKNMATSPLVSRRNSNNNSRRDEEEEGVNSTIGLFSSECTDEIVANEIITKNLDLQILEFLEGNQDQDSSKKTFSAENLESLEKLTISAIKEKTKSMDPELVECVHLLINSYLGKEIPLHKDMLISSVADLLFDEMVFSKVITKVDKSYVDEIKDLQEEEGILLKQREDDISKLRTERTQRLKSIQSIPEGTVQPEKRDQHSQRPSVSKPLPNRSPKESNDNGRPYLAPSSFAKYFLSSEWNNQNDVSNHADTDSLRAMRGSPAITDEEQLSVATDEDLESQRSTISQEEIPGDNESVASSGSTAISLTEEEKKLLHQKYLQEQQDLLLKYIDAEAQDLIKDDDEEANPNDHPVVGGLQSEEFQNATIEDNTEAIVAKEDQ
eukprot:TRINITY_DN3138_c0_g1_i6.p1 TRINITY_DN3138_c0_g1~~TRINITY_DN3138_c0_g1_i6.p1  ORF type:complete len:1095 (-),score=434.45 TRINITY_DN3138_c0_g1_i6:197-3481(-)